MRGRELLLRSETPGEFLRRLYHLGKRRMFPREQPRRWSVCIETCKACSHRCLSCPVSLHPFEQEVMTRVSFQTVLDRISSLPIERISFNHYNEPFLDPLIASRIAECARRGLCGRVLLNTNAEPIDREILEAIHPYRKLLDINVNLPTMISPERYRHLHGRGNLNRVCENITLLLDLRFAVRINVQANRDTTPEDAESVLTHWKRRVSLIDVEQSNSRCGLVLDAPVPGRGRIVGCRLKRPERFLHIGVDGDVFLCCLDYFKKYVFGNLLVSSLEEVLHSERRMEYLSYVSGKAESPEQFICRNCEFAVYETR